MLDKVTIMLLLLSAILASNLYTIKFLMENNKPSSKPVSLNPVPIRKPVTPASAAQPVLSVPPTPKPVSKPAPKLMAPPPTPKKESCEIEEDN